MLSYFFNLIYLELKTQFLSTLKLRNKMDLKNRAITWLLQQPKVACTGKIEILSGTELFLQSIRKYQNRLTLSRLLWGYYSIRRFCLIIRRKYFVESFWKPWDNKSMHLAASLMNREMSVKNFRSPNLALIQFRKYSLDAVILRFSVSQRPEACMSITRLSSLQ